MEIILKQEKVRLDVLLTDKHLCSSREKARALIMNGCIFCNDEKITKAGFLVSSDSKIEMVCRQSKYVGRGGLKLEKALNCFNIDIVDCVAIDVGASTGGFTDCMLQHGAGKVYAIDVGYGQLAWNLRQDRRVIVLERTNVRYITQEKIPELVDVVSIDVSFISLKLVVPVIRNFLKLSGSIIALIKPQFEAGRDLVPRGGVITDSAVHKMVLENMTNFVKSLNMKMSDIILSPIKGAKGNTEFLAHITQ